jgi:hypothetical protein
VPELGKNYYDLLRATVLTLSNNELSSSSKIQEIVARYKSVEMSTLLAEAISFQDEEHKSLDAEASTAFQSALEIAFEIFNFSN